VARFLAHGIRLPPVLRHAGVDRLNDIRSNWRAEDSGKRMGLVRGLAIGAWLDFWSAHKLSFNAHLEMNLPMMDLNYQR
jgi:hypothetical protein